MRKLNIVMILTAFFILVAGTYCQDFKWDNINHITIVSNHDTVVQIQLNQNTDINFPKYVTVFNSAKSLDIYECNYSSIPDCISNMADLEEVWVTRCYGLDINDLLYKLRNNKVKKLRLIADSLNNIPDNIRYMDNLSSLELTNNNIGVIPASLLKIKYLHLNDNHITRIEADSNSISNIEFLSLNSNNLTKMPAGLENIKSLQYLCLNDNPDLAFEDILNIVPMLPNLRIIEIRKINKDRNTPLPKNITNLQGKRFVLSIDHWQFSDEDLEKMEKLDIKFNHSSTKPR